MKTYNWVEIIYVNEYRLNNKNIMARYYKWKIYIYKSYHTKNKVIQQGILAHEYWHHILTKLPKTYYILWRLVSDGKLIKILNTLWIIEYKENNYPTDYAQKNFREDFCECHKMNEVQRLQNNYIDYNNYVDFKLKIVNNLINNFK